MKKGNIKRHFQQLGKWCEESNRFSRDGCYKCACTKIIASRKNCVHSIYTVYCKKRGYVLDTVDNIIVDELYYLFLVWKPS